MYARAAVGIAALAMNGLDLLEQPILLPSAGALPSTAPCVVSGPCHAIDTAHGTHTQFVPVLLYERKDFAFRSEQNRMAFFRISCSSLSLA